MKLTFLGAAQEVTGSCYLVEAAGARFLVECGMFQGGRETRIKNRDAFDFDPDAIDFVLLTHAHIDHSGLLPRLVSFGFKGPVYATTATCDLLAVMLPDSGHIQEKEAEWENARRHKVSNKTHADSAPLYTVMQALASLKRLRPVEYEEEVNPAPGIRCRFRDAGHILGSSIIELWLKEAGKTRKLVFSGDLGQPGHPLVRDATPIEETDVLVVESTYGNRLHKSMEDTIEELLFAIQDTLKHRGGNVIIPAFAVGRTQDMLYLLADLMRQGRLPALDIYVDSPMATAATGITLKHLDLLDPEARLLIDAGGNKHQPSRVHFVESVEESQALNHARGVLIISASGMCDAGRIKHHLRYNLPLHESSVLIIGFQAAGTLGRKLVDGAKIVRIFGQDVPVRARIYTIGGLSAHADQAGLLAWLGHFRAPPRQTFVVHGEAATAIGFAAHLRDTLGWRAEAPTAGQSINID